MLKNSTTKFHRLSDEKRQRILEASISEFSEKGYEAASMNKVVESAGISKGSLFNYFRTKSSLFLYVYHLALQQVKAYLRDVRDRTKDDPFFDRLQQIMYAGVEFIQGHPHLAKIYFHLLYTSDAPRSREILNQIRQLSADYLTEIIQQGIQRGEVNPRLKLEQAVFIIDSSLNQFLHHYHVSRSRIDVREWINGLMSVIRKGLAP
ncbi:MAG: TetR/AcrR family transcriptional regulator [Fidelibacterota bacterium]